MVFIDILCLLFHSLGSDKLEKLSRVTHGRQECKWFDKINYKLFDSNPVRVMNNLQVKEKEIDSVECRGEEEEEMRERERKREKKKGFFTVSCRPNTVLTRSEVV